MMNRTAVVAAVAVLVALLPGRPAAVADHLAVPAAEVVLSVDGLRPNDPRWRSQWGPRRVAAPEAWTTTTGRRSTVVAVLDTGVDLRHPDLRGALVPGIDLVNGDADPSDDHGHGTKVAGVIAARSDNGRGVASYCWHCSIMPVKVMRHDGYGTTSTVARGIVWATDNGADVITMSLSGTAGTPVLQAAVRYAYRRGVVLLSSAGNNGTARKRFPAAYAEVVGVAAAMPNDSRRVSSSYGDWVDVAAPGCHATTARGGGYVGFCGTSSAAPAVAGLVGLAESFRPTASASHLRQAVKLASTRLGYVSYGRVDASQTLEHLAALTSQRRPVVDAALPG